MYAFLLCSIHICSTSIFSAIPYVSKLPQLISHTHFSSPTCLFVCFVSWATLGGTQGLLLVLSSGVIPGNAQGTLWEARN